jgi:hypothetical protein
MERFPNPQIRGKNLSTEQEDTVRAQISAGVREHLSKMLSEHTERPKTPEEVESMIAALNLLRQEVVRLTAAEPAIEVKPEDIHILEDKAADVEGESRLLAGRAFQDCGEAIVVDVEGVGVMQMLHSIVHESTHLYSSSIATVRESADDETELEQWRDKGGYASTARFSPGRFTRNNFEGLNEAIIEQISLSVITDLYHKQEEIFEKEIYNDLDFTLFMSSFHRIGSYSEAILIVQSIVRRIAHETSRDEDEVWDEFKKAMFTGSLMHLRQIEEVYGKGSLRYLAEMPLSVDEYQGDQQGYEQDINQMRDFFS